MFFYQVTQICIISIWKDAQTFHSYQIDTNAHPRFTAKFVHVPRV